MIELSQHIERLLLENDCVIIPDFGGFVAFNNRAQIEENSFLPPTRTIGFNPQLKMNDGLLIQSYMASHDTDFVDASRIIDQEVKEMVELLQKNGKVELPHIGELHYSIHQTYEFTPYNNKFITPAFYGLHAFELKELSELMPIEEKTIQPIIPHTNKKTYDIRINRAFVRTAVASVAAVIMFFLFSSPIENTYVVKGSYANLLPVDIFETIESKSILTNQISTNNKVAKSKASTTSQNTKPIATKEIKVATKPAETKTIVAATPITPATIKETTKPVVEKEVAKPAKVETKITSGKYHLIVSSSIGMKNAETLVSKLKAEGYTGARVINGGERIRVSIMSLPTRDEANNHLAKIRTQDSFKDAWLLVQ